MKKIFSLSLIAISLLVSVHVKAVPTVIYQTNVDDLYTAVNAGGDIELGEDVTITKSINIYGGQTVNFDCKNHTLYAAVNNFNLFWGTLNIVAENGGGIVNTSTVGKSGTNAVWKTTAIQVYGSKNDEASYSNLNITGAKVTSQIRAIQLYVSNSATETLCGDEGDALNTWLATNKTSNSAYGVNINIQSGSTVNGGVYGVQVTGSIKQKTGSYLPTITIEDGAFVIGGDGQKCVGVYSSGYAKMTILGNVTGATGVYLKGGEVTIKGNAEISSNATVYSPTEYKNGKSGTSTESGSGVNAQGSAIIVEGSKESAYVGGSLTVEGNATIIAGPGFALEAVNFDVQQGETQNDKIEGITVKSGTFIGGDEGCMSMTPDIQGEVKQSGSIKGGSYTEDITDYLGTSTGIITQSEDEDGNIIYNVSSKLPDQEFKTSLAAVTAPTDIVQLAASETLAANVEVAYLAIPAGIIVTVPEGKTLKAGEIVLGNATSQLVIEAGGKVLVTSTQGIISQSVSNLFIKADATNGMGTFLLHPNVEANKQPMATVEYMCSSKAGKLTISDKTAYYWDIISSPFAEMISITTPGQSSYYQRIVDQAYVNVTDKQQIYDNVKAFDALAICPNANRGSIKYTMTGKLQGATSLTNYAVTSGFNHMGNAYMAKMNAKELVTELQQDNGSIRSLIYIWSVESQKYIVYTGYEIQTLGNINPMKSVFLYSDGEGTANLDYEKLIWNVNK